MEESIDILNELKACLLSVFEDNKNDLLKNLISTIHKIMKCDMCTLWSINYHEKNASKEDRAFSSASLLCRIMSNRMEYPYLAENNKPNEADFVHDYDDCFIKEVFEHTSRNNLPYYACGMDQCCSHRSFNALQELKLKYFVCVPIEEEKKIIAFVKLAYLEKPYFINLDAIAKTINRSVTSALSRHLSLQKQELVNDLINNYRKNGSQGIKQVFTVVIEEIFRKYFDYEGASVFIWDSFLYRYNLLFTTGLENRKLSNDINIYYDLGEGLTGKVAEDMVPAIYDNLKDLEKTNDNYEHKYKEKTKHKGKTLLILPILRPIEHYGDNNVLGIIRFTNKINKLSVSVKEESHINDYVIDYFNDNDIKLIDNALHYLSLNIDNYLSEEERKSFISKMSHEMKTPANAIRVNADCILKKYSDERFMRWHFRNYIQLIIDHANLQMMQTETNLFLSKLRRDDHSSIEFKPCLIKAVIEQSINIAKPIAEDHHVLFDNISIDESFPEVYYSIDDHAFLIVFYNLITNAIKYVGSTNNFSLRFSAEEDKEYFIIYVSDYGIGINTKDAKKIFNLGYRGRNAKQINLEGYGIGLHVIKQILNEIGGEIMVDHYYSPTTFKINIPISLRSFKKI